MGACFSKGGNGAAAAANATANTATNTAATTTNKAKDLTSAVAAPVKAGVDTTTSTAKSAADTVVAAEKKAVEAVAGDAREDVKKDVEEVGKEDLKEAEKEAVKDGETVSDNLVKDSDAAVAAAESRDIDVDAAAVVSAEEPLPADSSPVTSSHIDQSVKDVEVDEEAIEKPTIDPTTETTSAEAATTGEEPTTKAVEEANVEEEAGKPEAEAETETEAASEAEGDASAARAASAASADDFPTDLGPELTERRSSVRETASVFEQLDNSDPNAVHREVDSESLSQLPSVDVASKLSKLESTPSLVPTPEAPVAEHTAPLSLGIDKAAAAAAPVSETSVATEGVRVNNSAEKDDQEEKAGPEEEDAKPEEEDVKPDEDVKPEEGVKPEEDVKPEEEGVKPEEEEATPEEKEDTPEVEEVKSQVSTPSVVAGKAEDLEEKSEVIDKSLAQSAVEAAKEEPAINTSATTATKQMPATPPVTVKRSVPSAKASPWAAQMNGASSDIDDKSAALCVPGAPIYSVNAPARTILRSKKGDDEMEAISVSEKKAVMNKVAAAPTAAVEKVEEVEAEEGRKEVVEKAVDKVTESPTTSVAASSRSPLPFSITSSPVPKAQRIAMKANMFETPNESVPTPEKGTNVLSRPSPAKEGTPSKFTVKAPTMKRASSKSEDPSAPDSVTYGAATGAALMGGRESSVRQYWEKVSAQLYVDKGLPVLPVAPTLVTIY